MRDQGGISRREMIKIAGVAGAGMAIAGCVTPGGGSKEQGKGASILFENSYFYDSRGKFLVKKGKDAYISFGKVATGFQDPKDAEIYGWIVGPVRKGEKTEFCNFSKTVRSQMMMSEMEAEDIGRGPLAQ